MFETRSEAGSLDYEPITEPTKTLQMVDNVVETVKLHSGPSYNLITGPRVNTNPIARMRTHSLPHERPIQSVHGVTETSQNKATGTTYPKLLPRIEMFSPSHTSSESKLNMRYCEIFAVLLIYSARPGTNSLSDARKAALGSLGPRGHRWRGDSLVNSGVELASAFRRVHQRTRPVEGRQ